MLKLRQPCKHLSCSEDFPAEIPTKLNRYFYHHSSVACYIHYLVVVMVQGKGVRKGYFLGLTPPELDILQKLYYKGRV